MARSARRVAGATGAVGALVLTVAAFALKDRLVEAWYAHRVESAALPVEERAKAVTKLAAVGGERAVPVILRASAECRGLEGEELTAWKLLCADEIRKLGRRAVPVLLRFLDDPELRLECYTFLGVIGPAAEEAIPLLLRALDDAGELVRWYAALSLAQVAYFSPPTWKALEERFADVSAAPEHRHAALIAVERTALWLHSWYMRRHPDAILRVAEEAGVPLEEVARLRAELLAVAARVLCSALADRESEVRAYAVSASFNLERESRAWHVPDRESVLIAALEDPEREVVLAALRAASELEGPFDRRVAEAVGRHLKSEDSELRRESAAVLEEWNLRPSLMEDEDPLKSE